MTNDKLAESYLTKAEQRLNILPVLFKERDYSDVIREAQEIVELALKGLLRYVGIEPPKWHDVGGIIGENINRFPPRLQTECKKIAEISRKLGIERERSFYGDEASFVSPDELYDETDAKEAMEWAGFIVRIVKENVGR